MDRQHNRAGATEQVMRRVLQNVSLLSCVTEPRCAAGWREVIVEPGPDSDDAPVCLLVTDAPREPRSAQG